MKSTPITIARGDGIGPEIMQATLDILAAAGAKLDIEEIEIGETSLSGWKHIRHQRRSLGIASSNASLSQESDHDSARWRLQESQRHHSKDAWACSPMSGPALPTHHLLKRSTQE